MKWLEGHWQEVLSLAGSHLVQSILPLLLAALISIPVARLIRINGTRRRRTVRWGVVQLSALLYTIPSLALFVVLPSILGTQILDPLNIIVALTMYAIALLVRSAADALESVDPAVLRAADAMGYRPVRRFFSVDLPLSLPVLFPALRVVSVSNISLVSVGALIGIDNLGTLFMDGLRRSFTFEVGVGIVATLLLALLMDLILVLAQRMLTPWERARSAPRATRWVAA
ncbi:MAG: ABC transporter permease subunit [Micrococcaceae bacterium]|nr:ABC transporter permease subunit [Micrococcaceae bacterium]MDN6170270.1 ABC transporter permease subunit [Micrococcaceae bacterium]MDN6201723.1 ABC transporter permease subunit [Micrococcaceae bacterium]MDN6299918.1 ABC transporter permease subunit [Micrococcaceae bacterium]